MDTVENGLLHAEAVEMMVENGEFYVPTLNGTRDKEHILGGRLPDLMFEEALGAANAHPEGF